MNDQEIRTSCLLSIKKNILYLQLPQFIQAHQNSFPPLVVVKKVIELFNLAKSLKITTVGKTISK